MGCEDVSGHFLVGQFRMSVRGAESRAMASVGVEVGGFFAAVGVEGGRAGCLPAALLGGYGERGQTGSETG